MLHILAGNCTSGYEYNAARGNCDECQRGYYRNQFDRDQTTCQMCDINYITAGTKSESITDCNVSKYISVNVTIGTSLTGIKPLVRCVISTILQRAISQSPSLTAMSVSIFQ